MIGTVAPPRPRSVVAGHIANAADPAFLRASWRENPETPVLRKLPSRTLVWLEISQYHATAHG